MYLRGHQAKVGSHSDYIRTWLEWVALVQQFIPEEDHVECIEVASCSEWGEMVFVPLYVC